MEQLEARQLEDELKQQKEHEAEKRAIQTRLKHMEAYCRTPSPPSSPLTTSFEKCPSIQSAATVPQRHVTQQHYENLAQAYHIRDNMDNLHASKINVLRGKQKRALQNFMLKKERELEQMEKDHDKELDSVDEEYSKKEAEIKHEFEVKRSKLEARWKLQVLVEKARLERSTGLKYDDMPDIVATDIWHLNSHNTTLKTWLLFPHLYRATLFAIEHYSENLNSGWDWRFDICWAV